MLRVLLLLVFLSFASAFAQDIPDGLVVFNSYGCWVVPSGSIYEEWGTCFEIGREVCDPRLWPTYEGTYKFYNGAWQSNLPSPRDCDEEEEPPPEEDCVPALPDGTVPSGMLACEQTLADIRDLLTPPADDDFMLPDRTNPTSKTAAAFGSFIADSKALFVWDDIDINAKFPFGYAERLSNVDISATGCPSSGGAGLASAFNYCGSGVHGWLAPKVKAAMTFIAWLAFAVGVNATWAQAMA